MKVIIMLSLLQRLFWPSLVFLEHCLTFLTPEVPGDPRTPYPCKTFVATPLYMLLTKFGQHSIINVEGVANCQKERKKEEEERNRKKVISSAKPPNLKKEFRK